MLEEGLRTWCPPVGEHQAGGAAPGGAGRRGHRAPCLDHPRSPLLCGVGGHELDRLEAIRRVSFG